MCIWDFPVGASGQESSAEDARDMGLIPELGRSTGGGNVTPLQYSCLENSMGRGAWWAIIHGAAESRT